MSTPPHLDPRLRSLPKNSLAENQLVQALNQIMGELRDLRGEHQRTREQLKTMQLTLQSQGDYIQRLESRLGAAPSSLEATAPTQDAKSSELLAQKLDSSASQGQAPIQAPKTQVSNPSSILGSSKFKAEAQGRVQSGLAHQTLPSHPRLDGRAAEHQITKKLESIMFRYLRRLESEAHKEFKGEALAFSAALAGSSVFELLPTEGLLDFIAYELGETYALFPSLNSTYPVRRVQNLHLAALFQFAANEGQPLIRKIIRPAIMTPKGHLWTLIQKGELVFGQ